MANIRVIFVGDKPSPKMKPEAKPFEGASCEPRLKEWIKFLNVKPTLINQSQGLGTFICKLVDIYLLTSNETKIIALGNNASKALTNWNIPHFKLPHPSGLNRQINDKNYINQQLLACKAYIQHEKTLARARSLDASISKA